MDSSFSDIDSPRPRSASDEEASYATISSAPPKRRAGRTKFRETRHPTFKGVRRRNADKWVCEVREPNKKSRIWLGTFPTPEMAARAHDVAAIALRGRSACLNFADSAWRLPVAESTSPREIQRAAALAAEAFRPPECLDVNAEFQDRGLQDCHDTNQMMMMMMPTESSNSSSSNYVVYDDPFYMEEGLGFGMQGYYDGMTVDASAAAPPADAAESDAGMSLWSYSI